MAVRLFRAARVAVAVCLVRFYLCRSFGTWRLVGRFASRLTPISEQFGNGHYGAEATMNATRVGRKSMTETSITAWLSNTSTSSILLMRPLWQPKGAL